MLYIINIVHIQDHIFNFHQSNYVFIIVPYKLKQFIILLYLLYSLNFFRVFKNDDFKEEIYEIDTDLDGLDKVMQLLCSMML